MEDVVDKYYEMYQELLETSKEWGETTNDVGILAGLLLIAQALLDISQKESLLGLLDKDDNTND